MKTVTQAEGHNNAQVAKDLIHAKIPHVLTVAGSDSGAGAGIQADLKACAARGVYCSTVITAVTAQNTIGVQAVNIVPKEIVAEQLKSVLSDMQVDVVKTGMLPSIGIVDVLVQALVEFSPKALVVDPVLVSTSGDVLADPSILSSYREKILPMADIITPNIKEASALLGDMPLDTVAEMRAAAKLLYAMGPRNVLIKGGNLPDSLDAVDILFDGQEYHELCSHRIKTRNTHGTGCTLASCIAAELAKGCSMLTAVKVSKQYVLSALEHSKDMFIGSGGQGPFDHLLRLNKNEVQCSLRRRPFNPSNLLLYAVTDCEMNKKWGRDMEIAVEAAIEGGATFVQLRVKDAEICRFLEMAKACLEICHSNGVPLVINDRTDVVLACGADGVHIGQSDMPARVARTLLGPEKIIGVTCRTPEEAQQAWKDGADYIGCGSVYHTDTKPDSPTVGLEGLKAVCFASKLPVVAIGGINASNVGNVVGIGLPNLKGIAVISALFDRQNVCAAARSFCAVLMDAAPGLD